MDQKTPKKPKKSSKKGAKVVRYQIIHSVEDEELANRLSEITGMNRSVLYRSAMKSYYLMTVLQQPTCANGHACHCPQFHQLVTSMTTAELLSQPAPPPAATSTP